MKNTQVTLGCDTCGKEFKRKRSQVSESNYCSRECKNKGQEKVAYKKLCKSVGGDFKEWLEKAYTVNLRSFRNIALEVYGSEKNSSSVGGWMNRLGIPIRDRSDAVKTQWIDNDERRKAAGVGMKKRITSAVRAKIHATQQTAEYSRKQSVSKTGELNGMYGVIKENSSQWNPNRTDEQRVKDRKLYEYKRWREAVLSRDGYTCRVCGVKIPSLIVAHHFKAYMLNEDERFDVDNGITTCRLCHKEFHSIYGRRFITREQFEQFMKDRESATA